jgi:hypothetical protein
MSVVSLKSLRQNFHELHRCSVLAGPGLMLRIQAIPMIDLMIRLHIAFNTSSAAFFQETRLLDEIKFLRRIEQTIRHFRRMIEI